MTITTQDELVVACSVTQERGARHSDVQRKTHHRRVKYEDNGDKTAMNTIEENVDLSGEDWYVNCQAERQK